MREYSFISIPVKRRRDGLVNDTDYQDVIREKASDGWEFVQAISFETFVDPRIDLVFTRREKR